MRFLIFFDSGWAAQVRSETGLGARAMSRCRALGGPGAPTLGGSSFRSAVPYVRHARGGTRPARALPWPLHHRRGAGSALGPDGSRWWSILLPHHVGGGTARPGGAHPSASLVDFAWGRQAADRRWRSYFPPGARVRAAYAGSRLSGRGRQGADSRQPAKRRGARRVAPAQRLAQPD